MILLLGGSGYVGQAYQRLFTRLGVPFRNLARKEVDYTDTHRLADLLAETRRGVPDQRRRLHRQAQRGCLRAAQGRTACSATPSCPAASREACEATGTPWGHVSSGCIFTGSGPDGGGFREDDAPNFSFRTNHCSFYSGTKALGEEVLAGADDCFIWRLRIPFNEVDSPRNYLTKLMRYARLLEAANSLSQLDEFVPRHLRVLGKARALRHLQCDQPGHVTTREVVDLIRQSGVCDKEFQFFARRRGVHAQGRQDAALELRAGHAQAPGGGHRDDRGARGRRARVARMADGMTFGRLGRNAILL